MKLSRSFFYLCIMGLPFLASCAGRSAVQPVIDAGIPAGNIVFEKMSNDTVYVHQDLRDTEGDWFYWAFRARGFQGRTVTFVFTKSVAVGVRGPVVSFDQGKTYGYADATDVTRNKFTFAFPKDAKEVWMYECFPYTPEMWASFVEGIPSCVFLPTPSLPGRRGSTQKHLHF